MAQVILGLGGSGYVGTSLAPQTGPLNYPVKSETSRFGGVLHFCASRRQEMSGDQSW